MESLFTNFVFSNTRSWRITRHSVFWIAWVAFSTWIYGAKLAHEASSTTWGINTAFILSFVETVVYLPCHWIVTYALLYVLILRYLLHKRYMLFAVGVVIVYAVAVLVSLPILHYIATPIRIALGCQPPWSSFHASFSTAVKGGSSILGFAVGIKLLKLWYEKQRDNQLLLQKNLESELASLKAQIHPHFLFNTLNSLYALTLERSPDAPEAVLRLSAMLRAMLYDGAKEYISLETELELIRNYIELERLRFGDRVDISLAWNNADAANVMVAPFLFLPFVENAFKHGVSATSDAAWISLEVSVKSDVLTFRLTNSKPAEPCTPLCIAAVAHNTTLGAAHSAQEIPSGLGLTNVRKRLELLYPGRYRLNIHNEGETFVIALSIHHITRPSFPVALASSAEGEHSQPTKSKKTLGNMTVNQEFSSEAICMVSGQ